LAVTQAVMVIVGEKMYAIPSVMISRIWPRNIRVSVTNRCSYHWNEIDWKGNKSTILMEALVGGNLLCCRSKRIRNSLPRAARAAPLYKLMTHHRQIEKLW
jgi:hypothetical protein